MGSRDEQPGTGPAGGVDMRKCIIPPAEATKIRSADTPEWDAALAAHHHKLLKAGVTTWADEGKKLTAARRPPRVKKDTVGMKTEV